MRGRCRPVVPFMLKIATAGTATTSGAIREGKVVRRTHDQACPFCQKLSDLTSLTSEELIAPLEHSVVLLGPWQFYQGYCLVVARWHATELNQLTDDERLGYFNDLCRVARAVEHCFQPRKLN